MNEIEKLVKIIDEEHERSKRPAKFFWWLFILQWALVLGLILLAVMAWIVSSAR